VSTDIVGVIDGIKRDFEEAAKAYPKYGSQTIIKRCKLAEPKHENPAQAEQERFDCVW
jgi:hypothetical protein